ncbi:MAG: DUF397 domain-containing protein [Actinoallomurus sp.]
MTLNLSQTTWRKAEASASGNGGCVTLGVNLPPHAAAMRDSTRPDAGSHVTSRGALAALLNDVKAGRYDV